MNNAAKNFDILTISLSVLHNYFDSLTKLLFWSISNWNFRSFSKIVLSVYYTIFMWNFKYIIILTKKYYKIKSSNTHTHR